MRNRYWLLIGLLAALGCTEQNEPIPYTYTQVFTGKISKTWRLDRIKLREPGEPDATLNLNPCSRDDLYTFYANEGKELKVENGASFCGSDQEEELITYFWEFNQGAASLSMVLPNVFGYFFIPFTVKEARDNKMELEIFLDEDGTVSYLLEFKLVDEE
jgi:hypothetical protein